VLSGLSVIVFHILHSHAPGYVSSSFGALSIPGDFAPSAILANRFCHVFIIFFFCFFFLQPISNLGR
jgi:hypothetical protein